MARRDPVVLYAPPAALRHLALVVMLPVFPLLFAAYLPGRIRAAAKHPFLLAVKLWALGAPARQRHACRRAALRRLPRLGRRRPHLGEAPSGGPDARGAGGAAGPANDGVALIGGLVVYAVFILWAHRWIIGVSPLG